MFFQILFLLFLYSQPDLKTILPAKVVSVQDGDTITVEFSFRANIRLKDCWAPETRTKDEEEKKIIPITNIKVSPGMKQYQINTNQNSLIKLPPNCKFIFK